MPPHNRRAMYEEDSYSEATASSYERPPQRRRIHFAVPENQIHLIPHINDLSDNEVKETWYERSDYEKMKMTLVPIVRKMMKGGNIEETNRQTVRGLEYRTRAGAIRRQHNKAEAIAAVMDEQERQLGSGNGQIDDELLRKVYVENNAHCQREAHELALGDVEPAREHCADVSRELENITNRNGLDFLSPRLAPGRKSSFSKLFKQMRLRRRATFYVDRPIAGQAA